MAASAIPTSDAAVLLAISYSRLGYQLEAGRY